MKKSLSKKITFIFLIVVAALFIASVVLHMVGSIKVSNTTEYNQEIYSETFQTTCLADDGNVLLVSEQEAEKSYLSAYDIVSGENVWYVETPYLVSGIKTVGDMAFVYAGTDLYIFEDLTNKKGAELIAKRSFDYRITDVYFNANKGLIAVSASRVSMENYVYMLEFGMEKNLTQKYEVEVPYEIGNIVVDSNGKAIFSTTLGVYDIELSNSVYKTKKLFDADNDFKSMAITAENKIYLSTTVGTIEVWVTNGEVYYCEQDFFGLKQAGIIATNSNGLMCVVDEVGNGITIDTNTELIRAKFKTFYNVRSVSINNLGNVNTFKLGEGISFYDYENMPFIFFFGQIDTWLLVIEIVLAVLIVLLTLLMFDKTKAKVKDKAVKIYRSKKCYLYLSPTFALLILFSFYPIVRGISLVFYDYLPGIRSEFVGFDNFVSAFNNEAFWSGIKNMLLFLVTDLIKAFIPPFIIAQVILAVSNKQSQYWARVLMYIPGILPGVAGTLLWTTGILGPGGVLNQVLESFGLMSDSSWAWLANESTAKWALIFMGFPWIGSYLIYYGALQGISPSYYEASQIDGCGWFRRMLSIDIPMIAPQLKYIFITSFIGSAQDFGRVYLTTKGAYDTNIPALQLYLNISEYQNYGEAAAMGIIILVAVLGVVIMNMKGKKSEMGGKKA